jgi:hypothetical protein
MASQEKMVYQAFLESKVTVVLMVYRDHQAPWETLASLVLLAKRVKQELTVNEDSLVNPVSMDRRVILVHLVFRDQKAIKACKAHLDHPEWLA